MVRLLTSSSPIEAKLIVARLGAEGIVWDLRGSVDGPLPLGPIDVLVDADDFARAREMLLDDDLDAELEPTADHPAHVTTGRDVLILAAVLLLALVWAAARMRAS
jgi:hypothetical protein